MTARAAGTPTQPDRRRAVTHVVVIVPARDEEAVLGTCLDAVEAAVRRSAVDRPDVRVHVVVCLDRCVDGSADVVASRPVSVHASSAGCVGVARRSAVDVGLALAREDGGTPASTWVLSTDADCRVPEHWVVEHVALAESGLDLVVGTVEPGGPVDAAVLAAWRARHDLRDGHEHVHGANLGVRADAYAAAGGFPPLPLHEDVALVGAVRAAGRPWTATDRVRVRTSSRSVGRLTGGFASYLSTLAGLG